MSRAFRKNKIRGSNIPQGIYRHSNQSFKVYLPEMREIERAYRNHEAKQKLRKNHLKCKFIV